MSTSNSILRLPTIVTVDLFVSIAILFLIALVYSLSSRWNPEYPDTAAFVARQIATELKDLGYQEIDDSQTSMAVVRLPSLFAKKLATLDAACGIPGAPGTTPDSAHCIGLKPPGQEQTWVTSQRFVADLAAVSHRVLAGFESESQLGGAGSYHEKCRAASAGNLPCRGRIRVAFIEGHADRKPFAARGHASNNSLSLDRALSVYQALLRTQPGFQSLGSGAAPAANRAAGDAIPPQSGVLAAAGYGCRRPVYNADPALGTFELLPDKTDEFCPLAGNPKDDQTESKNRRIDMRIVFSAS